MITDDALRQRRADLDGLRGIAVLLIIFGHYVLSSRYFAFTVPQPIGMLLHSFWSGVDIFFVLSGFLIGGILIDNRRAGNFLRVFYLRRALRILPVALATIAFAYLALPAMGVYRPLDQQVPPLAYLLFINNFWTAHGVAYYPPLFPLWSLAIEEQFYLVAPAFFLFVPSRWWAKIAALIILGSPLLRLADLGFSPYDFTLCRLDGLFAGILVAIMVRDERFRAYAAGNRWKIGAFTAGIVAAQFLFSMAWEFDARQQVAFGVSLNSLAAASVIVYLTFNRDSQLFEAISRQWLVTLGKWSYFLYMMHIPLLLCMRATSIPLSLQPVVAFVVCLVAAWASWRYMEAPLIGLGRRRAYAALPALASEAQSEGSAPAMLAARPSVSVAFCFPVEAPSEEAPPGVSGPVVRTQGV